MATLDINGVLGDDGYIAKRLKTYESRPEQIEMAEAVRQAIETKSHLIAEAGTGVGKSFAYLVPAILAATKNQGATSASQAELDGNRSNRAIPKKSCESLSPLIRFRCKNNSTAAICHS